jgi:hypothetical protein
VLVHAVDENEVLGFFVGDAAFDEETGHDLCWKLEIVSGSEFTRWGFCSLLC